MAVLLLESQTSEHSSNFVYIDFEFPIVYVVKNMSTLHAPWKTSDGYGELEMNTAQGSNALMPKMAQTKELI